MLSIITAPKCFVNTHLAKKVLTCNTPKRKLTKNKTPAAFTCRRFITLNHWILQLGLFNEFADNRIQCV